MRHRTCYYPEEKESQCKGSVIGDKEVSTDLKNRWEMIINKIDEQVNVDNQEIMFWIKSYFLG